MVQATKFSAVTASPLLNFRPSLMTNLKVNMTTVDSDQHGDYGINKTVVKSYERIEEENGNVTVSVITALSVALGFLTKAE